MKRYCFITSIILFMMLSLNVYAAQTKEILKVNIEGEEKDLRILNQEYENNVYISLTDMSYILKDTEKAFVVEFGSKDGMSYVELKDGVISEEDYAFDKESFLPEEEKDEKVNYARKRNLIGIDGNDYSFYSIIVNEKEYKDCYVNLGEFALAMDIDMSIKDNVVYINPKSEFNFNKNNIIESGIADMADSCMVGDVTTGNIFFSSNADEAVAIASTTKLMTYLVIKDAMSEGKISENDTIVFSKKASDLSKTSNGVVNVEEGQRADIRDVIDAMLICSSNECALALAEHLCSNEEDFVELMNRKAIAIGLSQHTEFNNPHGLPVYKEDVLTIKHQNRLSANDMFKLSGYILDRYPEITEITSVKKTRLASLNNFEAKNTNTLLSNVPGTVGLKTGTTDKAQSCLVSAYPMKDMGGNTHYVVAIVYGAENVQTQGYASMVLMRYGIQKFNATQLGIMPGSEDEFTVPKTFDELAGAVINAARRNIK